MMSGPKIEDGFQVWRNNNGEEHREDGPAVEGPDHQEWYINGLRHRTDGPAHVTPDHTSYYVRGKRHRTDGPAFIMKDYKAWWVDGLRHRHDGPAVIDPESGDEYWLWGVKFFSRKEWEEAEGPFKIVLDDDTLQWRLRDGRLHRKDGPAVDHPERKEYWQDGNLHREDGPAVIQRDKGFEFWLRGVRYTPEEYIQKMTVEETDEDGTTTYRYLGNLHREDGPAVISRMEDKDGKSLVSVEFWKHGVRHREDGPAHIGYFGEEEYWKDGELHREDGPAIINVRNSLEPLAEIWIQNGKRHREDGPAVIAFDGTHMYYEHGKIHRLGGPAITGPQGDAWYLFGEEYSEDEYWEKAPTRIEEEDLSLCYFVGKVPHRIGGPAMIHSDGEQWAQRGLLHREDGPAIVRNTHQNEWYFKGNRHREDGPAVDYPGILKWYVHGKLHRVGGPAVIRQWPTPIEQYWLDGTEYSREEYERITSPASPSPLQNAYHQSVALAKIHTASSILSASLGAPSSPTFQAILRILIPTLIHRFTPSEDIRRQAEKALEAVFFEIGREKMDILLQPILQAILDPTVRESLFTAVEARQESV